MGTMDGRRSEEHTSELQSHSDLVCRLLLEKKKQPHRPVEELHRPAAPGHLDHRCPSEVAPEPLGFDGGRGYYHLEVFFFLMIRRPPRSTLFPYTRSSDLPSARSRAGAASRSRPRAVRSWQRQRPR